MGIRFYSIIAAAAFAAPAGFGAELKPEPPLGLRVRVYDYAQLPNGTLQGALEQAGWILRKAGVKTTWYKCAPSPEEMGKYPECNNPPTPVDIVVRILPRKMAVRLSGDYNVSGIAALAEKVGFGSHASVFYDRVEEIAEWWAASKPMLLGHLLVHEIGHLLLGPNSHSPSGIMHVPWNKNDIERAQTASLLFTPDEARRIQGQVRKRMEAAIAQREISRPPRSR
jgi:hypothetical protein